MISPQLAARILREITEHSQVPAAPEGLARYYFLANGHVMIGDTALRGYKHKNRWFLMDKDVRQAGHNLAHLVIDTDDLVPVALPAPDHHAGARPHEGHRWRSWAPDWVEEALYQEHSARGCACSGDQCRTEFLQETRLPHGINADKLVQAAGRDLVIASTRPLPLMSWSAEQGWMLPRAYADMLTRAEQVEADLGRKADVCSGCGTIGDHWQWRTSSKTGFVTLCPACAAQRYRPYTGHLQGVRYETLGRHQQADEYLCCLCSQPRRAYYWDHCHQHGLVRGPVCASCNTFEGGGRDFTRRAGGAGVRHLMRCDGCRSAGTIPAHHHGAVIKHEVKPEPHKGCTAAPRVAWCATEPDGSVTMNLHCWHDLATVQWTQLVPADRVDAIVRAYVERHQHPEEGPDGAAFTV